jgi:hypothetical protein
MDPTIPDSWEECVVNLVVLDMLRNNKTHVELDYTDGYSTFSYPYLQEKETTLTLKKPFVNAISENIIGTHFSQYPLINQALYSGLMGKHKVMLGDMPETLLRRQLGNSISIDEMRDLFKFVLKKKTELKENISFKEASILFLPHIFQAPRDLFMTAMLKEAFQASTSMLALVGLPHYNPILQYWEPAPYGINYTEATRIPDRIRGETDEVH